jgi:hypothetical protein
MSEAWPFHDKTQNILCLRFDHFMTKHTDSMSGDWPFDDKTHCYYVWGLNISWQTDWCYVWGLIISWQSKQMIYLGLDHFMTKHTGTMSWSLTISWQTTLIPCLRLDILMTKPTDSMSGSWPFHEKTDWYYVCGLTISWQNRLTLCLKIDPFTTNRLILHLGFANFTNCKTDC